MTIWVLIAMLAIAPSGEQQIGIYTAGPHFPTLAQCIEIAAQSNRAMGCVEVAVSRPSGHPIRWTQ